MIVRTPLGDWVDVDFAYVAQTSQVMPYKYMAYVANIKNSKNVFKLSECHFDLKDDAQKLLDNFMLSWLNNNSFETAKRWRDYGKE